jgi:hypothetical protein
LVFWPLERRCADMDGGAHANWGTPYFAGRLLLTKSTTDAAFKVEKNGPPYFSGSTSTVRQLLTHLDSDPTCRRNYFVERRFTGRSDAILRNDLKVPKLVAVPPSVVTAIFPVFPPVGMVTVIWVSELTVKLADFTPPKVTLVGR